MNTSDLWKIYFAQVAGIQFHPANDENLKIRGLELTLTRCAKIADIMVRITEERCPSDQQPS